MSLGGHGLNMSLSLKGVSVSGNARHAVVNGTIINRPMAGVLPTEVTAAVVGAAATFILMLVVGRKR